MDPSSFEAGINECLKSCTSTAMSSGPVPRWQKKLQGQTKEMPLSPLANRTTTPATRAKCTTPGNHLAGNLATKKTPGNVPFNFCFERSENPNTLNEDR